VGGAGKEHGFDFGGPGPGVIWLGLGLGLGRFERLTSNNPPYFLCDLLEGATKNKHFVMRLCLRRDMYQESGVVTLRR
jgi:hypothetical protein